MQRELVIGGFYRHFKNKLYQVRGVAIHSETKEKMVVYQGLYGSYELYVRPYDMFLSEVDHNKYPDVEQKYRFEKVKLQEEATPQEAVKVSQEKTQPQATAQPQETSESEEQANPFLLRFLDADTYEEKYKILNEMENDITDRLINDFSVVLDVVIPEGDLTGRYIQLKQCVATMCRYETTRLR